MLTLTLTPSTQVFPRALSLGHEQSALGHSHYHTTAEPTLGCWSERSERSERSECSLVPPILGRPFVAPSAPRALACWHTGWWVRAMALCYEPKGQRLSEHGRGSLRELPM